MTSGRAIDHIGIAGTDLDKLAAQYAALGFALTPRAQHPEHIGTANRLVQLQERCFLELISAAGAPPPPGPLNFGTYTRDFLTRRAGINLVVFRTDDRDADLARWRAAGLDTCLAFDFERSAVLPDGSQRTVRFELGFVTNPDIDALFFVCDNKAEDNFWKPEFQDQPNGAVGIDAVAFVADDPAAHAGFFAALFDGEITPVPCGITISCGTGHRVEICPPDRLVKKGWDDSARPRGVAQGAGILVRTGRSTGAADRKYTPPAEAGGAFIEWT